MLIFNSFKIVFKIHSVLEAVSMFMEKNRIFQETLFKNERVTWPDCLYEKVFKLQENGLFFDMTLA